MNLERANVDQQNGMSLFNFVLLLILSTTGLSSNFAINPLFHYVEKLPNIL